MLHSSPKLTFKYVLNVLFNVEEEAARAATIAIGLWKWLDYGAGASGDLLIIIIAQDALKKLLIPSQVKKSMRGTSDLGVIAGHWSGAASSLGPCLYLCSL